jgi:small-conductance mechanosensitive channel
MIVISTFFCIFLFDQLFAVPTGLNEVLQQVGRILIVIVFGAIALIVIRKSKALLSKHVGTPTATVFQILMMVITVIIMIFAILDIIHFAPSTLLIGGGAVSIIFGLILSNSIGDLLAGTFILMTHQYKVGDTVLINNIPCKVEKITPLVTRVQNDFGGLMSIPNTAIMQGSIIVTSFHEYHEYSATKRLPYAKGDRIYTTYLNQEGVVTDLSPFHTQILLDSGMKVTFLNTTVLTGTVAVAKIKDTQKKQESIHSNEKTDDL